MLRRLLVLGSLELTIDGAPVELGGPKQRLVLAILAAARGAPVALERIVDGVWDDEPPARAEASVQSYISNLRRLFEPDRSRGAASRILPLDPGGYRLRTELIDVDADRFEDLADEGHDLLASGRPDEASVALAEGSALWRGPAFGAATDHPLVLPESTRLQELRWRSTEDRWTAELACSRHERAIPELHALTRTAPLRERTWVLLGTALARSGRQVEALRAVRDGMDALREGAGLEPGSELAALERALLERAPELGGSADVNDLLTPTTTATPTDPLDEDGGSSLVARHDEYQTLLDALDAAGSGHGRAVVISGEAGIGKTFLAQRLAAAARSAGWLIGWGRCPEAADVPGLWPWREALSSLGQEAPGGSLAGLDHVDLGPLAPDRATADTGSSSTFAIGAALSELLREVSMSRPCLIVLDDAHWADAGTLQLLRHVTVGLAGSRILLVITHRDTDPDQRQRLAPLRSDVARSTEGIALSLEGLPLESVRSLVERAGDETPSDAEIEELHRRTGGNPFFISELVRSGGGAAPTGVRDVIHRLLEGLRRNTRAVLDGFAVAGEEADVRLVADACGFEPADVLDALDEAESAGLVQAGGAPHRYVFVHDLIRETVYDELGPSARARLHRDTERAIERRWGDDRSHLSARAWHVWMGSAMIDPEHVLDIVRRAASAADEGHRLDEAAERWGWAAELVDATDSIDVRFAVLSSFGRALVRAGNVLRSRDPLLRAAQLAEQDGRWADAADVMTTTSELSLWVVNTFGAVDEDAVTLLERTLEHLEPDDHDRRALVAARVALELYYGNDEARIDHHCEMALHHARRSATPRVLAVVLTQRFAVRQRPHLMASLLDIVDELRGVGPDAGLEAGEIEAITGMMTGWVRTTLGQLDEAAEEMAAADRIVASGRLPYLAAQLRWYHVTRLILAGHVDAAESAFAEADAFYSRVRGIDAAPTSFLSLIGLRFEQGRPEELLDPLRALSADDRPSTASFEDILLVALLDAGLEDEARQRARRIPMDPRPRDWVWLSVTCGRAWARARLGDTDACRTLRDELDPYSGQIATTGQLPPTFGAVDFFLGLLAEATGDLDAAQEHLLNAVALNEALGARSWLARSLHALARVADDLGSAPGEAESLRLRAEHLARQVGSPVLITQVSGR